MTRNDAINRAAGQYIALLDDDDEWLPEKLEKQVSLLSRSGPSVGLVYSGFRKIDARNNKVLGEVMPRKRGNVFDQMTVQNWIGTCSTVLLQRNCLTNVGLFDEQLVSGADYDLWLRISQKYDVEYINEVLVNYNVHDNNLTHNYSTIVRGMEANNQKYGALFALHKKAYSDRYHSIGIFYCLAGNLRKGREAFLRAIRLYPFDLRYYLRFAMSYIGAKNFKRINSLKEKLTTWLREILSV